MHIRFIQNQSLHCLPHLYSASSSCTVPLFLSSSRCKTQLTTHRFISSQNNLVCIGAFLSASYLLFESFSSLRLILCFISHNHQHNVHFSLSPLSSFSLQIQSDIFCLYSIICGVIVMYTSTMCCAQIRSSTGKI